MKKNNWHIEASPITNELKNIISSPAYHSITRNIDIHKTSFKNNEGENENIILLDTPGESDY